MTVNQMFVAMLLLCFSTGVLSTITLGASASITNDIGFAKWTMAGAGVVWVAIFMVTFYMYKGSIGNMTDEQKYSEVRDAHKAEDVAQGYQPYTTWLGLIDKEQLTNEIAEGQDARIGRVLVSQYSDSHNSRPETAVVSELAYYISETQVVTVRHITAGNRNVPGEIYKDAFTIPTGRTWDVALELGKDGKYEPLQDEPLHSGWSITSSAHVDCVVITLYEDNSAVSGDFWVQQTKWYAKSSVDYMFYILGNHQVDPDHVKYWQYKPEPYADWNEMPIYVKDDTNELQTFDHGPIKESFDIALGRIDDQLNAFHPKDTAAYKLQTNNLKVIQPSSKEQVQVDDLLPINSWSPDQFDENKKDKEPSITELYAIRSAIARASKGEVKKFSDITKIKLQYAALKRNEQQSAILTYKWENPWYSH
jgi:hypothetical protein